MNYEDKIPIINKWFDYSNSLLPPGSLAYVNLKKPVKWELKVIDPYGRCLVATDDIKEGEKLFVDYPVITGPKQHCEPLCLGCYKQLDVSELYECSKCGWPMCGPECETEGYHHLECEVYQKSSYRPQISDFGEDNPMYESMLPLRCLLLEGKYPEKWNTLKAMESHDELRKGTDLWQVEQKTVCEYLRNKVKVKFSEEFIHKVTGILDVNCHEVRSNIPDTREEIRVRGLYPLCAMMSHDCSSNTHHTMSEGMGMIVIASRNIYKGHQITGTYTHLLSGTIERRKHLKYGKFFDCLCDRCKDPTEFETYLSALRCSKNRCGGNIYPHKPIHPENKPDFICDKCQMVVRCGIVNRLTNTIYKELQNIDENDPVELEMVFKKYQGILHPNHYHMINIKHSLGQIYGRVSGYLISDLSPSQMQRKIDCCRDLLNIVDRIDPGISRLRGLTLYELHAPLLLRANRSFQELAITKPDFLEVLNESLDLLQCAIQCLQFEPPGSFEGQICKIARGSKEELSEWIKTVEELPESRFMRQLNEPNSVLEDLTLKSLLKQIEQY